MGVSKYFSGAMAAGMASILLAGCATVPADRSGSVSTELLKPRSALAASVGVAKAPADVQSIVAGIAAKPIGRDEAVRLALLQNPRMRVLYSELGFAQADVYDATRLSNPVLGYLRLSGNGVSQTTWSISQSFTELLFIGYRTRIGRSQLLQTQQRVASDVLALEAEVRTQYYRYVGAEVLAQIRTRSTNAAQASAQYAQQLYKAGNISALQLSREQAAAGAAEIKQRQSVSTALAERGALLNLLGLPLANSQLAFVEELPLPTPFSTDAKELRSWALSHRLDLAAAREAVSMWADNVTHARRWRWLGGVSVGAEREHDKNSTGDQTIKGPSASLELPLFNQGGSQLLRARAHEELAATHVAALELTISNDIVVRHAALQAAAANVEQYRRDVVPLNEKIVELAQQQQNYMLIGAFELLAAKQQEIDASQSYVEAVRDYWIEHAELMRVTGGNLPTVSGDKP